MKCSIGGIVCGRDAATGRFIPVKLAKKRKATAIVQKLKVSRTRDGKFVKRRLGAN